MTVWGNSLKACTPVPASVWLHHLLIPFTCAILYQEETPLLEGPQQIGNGDKPAKKGGCPQTVRLTAWTRFLPDYG